MKAFSISFFRLVLCSALLLFTAVCPLTTATAQTTAKKASPEEERKRQQELERKTLVLLDEIASAGAALKLPENRTFVLVSSGSLMWRHDQKRARNIFWEAINTLNVMRPVKAAGSDKSKNEAYFETFGWRREILRVVAEHDAQFALELLQASRQTPPESTNSEWIFATERELEQQIAAIAAITDPKRALQLARESLSKGLSLELVNLLFQINEKDTELGSKFAGEVVDKIRAGGMTTELNAPFIAIQLLISSRIVSEKAPQLQSGYRANRLTIDKEERRALVEMLADSAFSVSASSMVLSLVGEIMPEIEEFFPERVLLLKRKLAERQQRLPKKERDQEHYNSLVLKGAPEEMIRAALKGNDEERFWLEREAILAAVASKKAESLREFVNNQVDDETRRKRILDSLDAEEIDVAAYLGDTEALQKLLPKIRLQEQRARAMTEIAMVLETKGEHSAAVSLLDEAENLIKIDLQSETKSNALLNLMVAYALIEPARAFAIVEKTIDRANDEVSKALVLDKFIKSGMVKKGEIILHHSGSFPMDFAMLKYGKGVTALAVADFGRTKAAADRFERHEFRIFARLLIAQALLGKKSNTLNFKLH